MKLLDEIQLGESKTLELKEKLPSSDNLAKTIIAFSNTSGGKIIIGVNDNRKVIGLNNEDIFKLQEQISSIIYDKCYPHILPEIYTSNINGLIVLVIQVFRGNLLPYYLKKEGKNNGTYLRIASTNRKAAYENILELERQRLNISFDEEINFDYDLEKLDLLPIKNKFLDRGKNLDEKQLRNLKLVKEEHGKVYPTNALLILLGKFDNVLIKCARFKGINMAVFLDRKEFTGDIFKQLEESENFIKNHINLSSAINGLQRTDIYELPLEAIREALLNAFVHRDYSNMGKDIKLGIYDDLLNIVSPGGFPNTLTQENILEGRSEIRNKIIAKIFKELGYIEQWGTGILRIKSSCEKFHLKEPVIEEKGDFVDVEIYRFGVADSSGKVADSSGKVAANLISNQENIIVNYLKSNDSISSNIVEKLLNVKNARSRKILKNMIEKDLIQRKGAGRNTYYILK